MSGAEIWAKQRFSDLTEQLRGFRSERFLAATVLALTRVLGVRHAFVSRLVDEHTIQALFFANRRNLEQPFTYLRASSPCQQVLLGARLAIPCELSSRFPGAPGLDSYVGCPLHDRAGQVLGLIAIEDEQAMSRTDRALALLELMADRVAAELELLNV